MFLQNCAVLFIYDMSLLKAMLFFVLITWHVNYIYCQFLFYTIYFFCILLFCRNDKILSYKILQTNSTIVLNITLDFKSYNSIVQTLTPIRISNFNRYKQLYVNARNYRTMLIYLAFWSFYSKLLSTLQKHYFCMIFKRYCVKYVVNKKNSVGPNYTGCHFLIILKMHKAIFSVIMTCIKFYIYYVDILKKMHVGIFWC